MDDIMLAGDFGTTFLVWRAFAYVFVSFLGAVVMVGLSRSPNSNMLSMNSAISRICVLVMRVFRYGYRARDHSRRVLGSMVERFI